MHTRRTLSSSNNTIFKPVGLCLVVSLLMLTPMLVQYAAAQHQIPETMAYQGYLTNTDGDPADGTASVVFRLYDRPSGGTALWEETQQDVLFTDGVFTVHLGSVESLAEVSFGQALWLGVSVAGSQELTPRVALEAVPFAMGVHGLRVEPGTGNSAPSPNLIGGYAGNHTDDNVSGATIGGGGAENNENIVTRDFGTINGGADNRAGASATVGGGVGNDAGGDSATISGGLQNEAGGTAAAIGGGAGNRAEAIAATIAGGSLNTASGDRATVGGGNSNRATDQWATIGGGNSNSATAQLAVVGGGEGNVAEGPFATVAGGSTNAAQGTGAMVPGGQSNFALGDHSFAAGFAARADHDGSFVWADYFTLSDPPFVSTATRQFLIRARGGVGIGTNAPRGALHVAGQTLDIDANSFSDDALIVEGDQPVIGVYGSFQANTRPGLVLAGVDNGSVVDKWGIVREFFSGNALHFTYGRNEDHTQNPALMTLSSAGRNALSVPDGVISSGQLRATDTLGPAPTPAAGSVYQDNVVYAWANVNADGSVSSSFGCTVSKITGTGSYRITFKRQLPDGASVTVTPRTVNDPVIATAVINANQADVATKVFNGAAFVAFDSAFFVQVVGRP